MGTHGASNTAIRPFAANTLRSAATSRIPSALAPCGARAVLATMAFTTGGDSRSSMMLPSRFCMRPRT